LTKWLDPTVNVIHAFSTTLVNLVFPPANVVFAGIGILLSAVKDVRASQDKLVDLFERIEMFFQRLEIYKDVPPTTEMTDVIVRIMVEVLCVLGIATNEIKQSRMKKYARKLIGRTEMEDAMKRLDKLTQKEARMAAAQNLKVTHAVDERVMAVVGQVKAIDNRVVDVDDRVQVVDDKVTEVVYDGKQAKIVMQQKTSDVDQVKRNQLRENIRQWLSPPDTATNHNIACNTHHKKTASWFCQGSIYREWKSTGSLLWVHGKPGSGKTVLSSTVIQDIETTCKAGNASMAYFYFDFRDANKQGLRNLLCSLITQLSAHSAPRCDILSYLYSAHDEGMKQPSDSALAECLKGMLTLPDQRPTYLIVDALDESPNRSRVPSARERVLQFLKELVDLALPNFHICVTSRPETDIRYALEPLTSRQVSLHDQSGQKEDIADYVRSVVYSSSEPIMRRWRTEDKELVIKTLSEQADGMFRWVSCQLEILRDCLPPSIRHTLEELPESLDETYERILMEIKKPNRDHARRLLQCLVVAIRPLHVEELAEVLAVNFDDTEIPNLNPNWRWENQEQALVTSCSSLIAIDNSDGSRIVQFSHFSVKEFLTSARLATSSEHAMRYHIALEPAHTILAQACMGILLRSDDHDELSGNDVGNNSPLARYAAEHWAAHAQFEHASSYLRTSMESLFDLDKPYFAAWLKLYDIDTRSPIDSSFYMFTPIVKRGASPLYYAALCGFQDLVEYLIVKYPQDVNASGGCYLTPLVASLARKHFQTAELLSLSGADPNVQCYEGNTPLHSAACYGDVEMVQVLLNLEADVDIRNNKSRSPLNYISVGPLGSGEVPNYPQLLANVARLLLEHGADIDARNDEGQTPLHTTTYMRRLEVIRVLLEYGANVGVEDKQGRTPFSLAKKYGYAEIMKLLSEYGAQ
jgi:ankyrin repeat protein